MDDELVPVADVARRLGLSRWAVWRRLGAAGVTAYADPRDRRRRLIRAGDAEAITAPVPMGRPRTQTRTRTNVATGAVA